MKTARGVIFKNIPLVLIKLRFNIVNDKELGVDDLIRQSSLSSLCAKHFSVIHNNAYQSQLHYLVQIWAPLEPGNHIATALIPNSEQWSTNQCVGSQQLVYFQFYSLWLRTLFFTDWTRSKKGFSSTIFCLPVWILCLIVVWVNFMSSW